MSYQNLLNSGILEIFLVVLFICLGLVLYLFFRYLNKKYLLPKGKRSGLFLSKIISPLAFLIALLCVRQAGLVKGLQLSPGFQRYVDAAAYFFLFFFLVRLLDAFLVTNYERREKIFPLPRILHRFLLLVIYLVFLFVVLKGVAAVDITPLLATSAVLTMILGLALQELLRNVISGISIHITKAFRKGDWIKNGDNEGLVMDTNWRETRIKDLYSNIVVIPNHSISTEILINYSRPDKRTALIIPVKVSYESPPESVMEALREAALDMPEVSRVPPPEAYILSYEDFGISYVLKFWITDFSKKYQVMGEAGRLIWYKFRRRGIEIPLPLSDKVQHVFEYLSKTKTGELPEQKEKMIKYQSLLNSSFLRHQKGEHEGKLIVSDEEIKKLASSAQRQFYSSGETLFKQGDKGESCFIVISGKIKGMVTYEEKGKKYTSEFYINPGGIFGEMSLYTGMPRTATGIIEGETQLLEIGAGDFAFFLSRNPELAEITAGIVSDRNKENRGFLKKIKELSEKDIRDSCDKMSLLKRMKKFLSFFALKR
jgi:small-conductance mechanosensitive channel/CRP-like cAMP-binding protein